MATWTEEYWDVDGTPLHTYAYGVEVLSEGIPPRRGSNFIVPFRHGQIWKPKLYDARPLALAMWVINEDVDGNLPGTEQGQRAQLRQNVEALKALFAPYSRQLTITRRIRLNAGLVSRQGLAECTGTLDFVPEADVPTQVMRFGVELAMADPYWYDLTQTVLTIPVGGVGITNPGSARATSMLLQLNGPLTNPQLSCAGVSVTYTGVIASGHYVVLDATNYTAFDDLGANVIANVTHTGAHAWMEIAPGSSTMGLSVSAGAGNAQITFYPPYL